VSPRSPRCRKLEHEDGTPADPPVLHTAVPNWQAGGRHDSAGPGSGAAGEVIEVRPVAQADDEGPVLVVEDAFEKRLYLRPE
jgi:hypothetical protein